MYCLDIVSPFHAVIELLTSGVFLGILGGAVLAFLLVVAFIAFKNKKNDFKATETPSLFYCKISEYVLELSKESLRRLYGY